MYEGHNFDLGHVRGSIFLDVGHDERSGSEPDIRPACPVASTPATGSLGSGTLCGSGPKQPKQPRKPSTETHGKPLAHLAAHEHEAREMEPIPAGLQCVFSQQRPRKYRPYPLHHAAVRGAPRCGGGDDPLLSRAVRKQNCKGEYPLHLAAKTAGSLFRGTHGLMCRRPKPAETLCAAAADCVELLLQPWPSAGATACDDLGLSCGAPVHTSSGNSAGGGRCTPRWPFTPPRQFCKSFASTLPLTPSATLPDQTRVGRAR